MPGDPCDLWFEDAWWDAEFSGRHDADRTRVRVRSVQYDAYHEVDATRLRPSWTFHEHTGTMSSSLQRGVMWTRLVGHGGEGTGQFPQAMPRQLMLSGATAAEDDYGLADVSMPAAKCQRRA